MQVKRRDKAAHHESCCCYGRTSPIVDNLRNFLKARASGPRIDVCMAKWGDFIPGRVLRLTPN